MTISDLWLALAAKILKNLSRCVIMVIEMKNASEVPRFAEPFSFKFNAGCRFRIVMSPDDLARADLDAPGKQRA